MPKNLLQILERLSISFPDHVYPDEDGRWICRGDLLRNSCAMLYDFWHDENDQRIYVVCVIGFNGSEVRGVAVLTASDIVSSTLIYTPTTSFYLKISR